MGWLGHALKSVAKVALPAAAAFIPGVGPAVATAVGGVLAASGSKKAAKAQVAGQQAGIDEQRRQFDILQQQQQPWIQAGTGALNRLQDPNAFQASPDYAFRQQQGLSNIQNSFAARGGALSGNALRALTDYNSNLASSEYGNWWNRQAGLAGIGQAATNNVGSAGLQTGANVANLLNQQGNARASGIEGQYNAYGDTLGGLANLYGQWSRNKMGGYTTPPFWGGN